jgi:hypothetical protein
VTAAAQHAGPLLETELKPRFQWYGLFKQRTLRMLTSWPPGSGELIHSLEASQCAEPDALTSNRSQW